MENQQLYRLSFRKCLQILLQKNHVFIHKINLFLPETTEIHRPNLGQCSVAEYIFLKM